ECIKNRQVEILMSDVCKVGAFLLGAPKCGTTWLAEVLTQHPGICVSEPKEPNIVASHKGTFGRDESEPNWKKYADCFTGDGLRIDCSVHAMACPIAPSRVADNWPDARLIICLRDPVGRTVSHWNMVLDSAADKQNGTDWSNFEEAWADPRLSVDSFYGAAVSRWLEHFDRDSILLIGENRMRNDSSGVLEDVCNHLSVAPYSFDFDSVKNANTAAKRRPITVIGRTFRFAVGLVPNFITSPIVKWLQSRDFDVYKLPVMSVKPTPKRSITEEQRTLIAPEINADLKLLQDSTGFDCSEWYIQ
ncbi:MAG: sulfotransferase domain-containing protein, partial [Candidatus Poseidoniaceae archaeon]